MFFLALWGPKVCGCPADVRMCLTPCFCRNDWNSSEVKAVPLSLSRMRGNPRRRNTSCRAETVSVVVVVLTGCASMYRYSRSTITNTFLFSLRVLGKGPR